MIEDSRRERLEEQLFKYFDLRGKPTLQQILDLGYEEHLSVLYEGSLEAAFRDYERTDEGAEQADLEARANKSPMRRAAEFLVEEAEKHRHDIDPETRRKNRLLATQVWQEYSSPLNPFQKVVVTKLSGLWGAAMTYDEIAREYGTTMDDVSDAWDEARAILKK